MQIRKAQPSDMERITAIQVESLQKLCAKSYRDRDLQALIRSKQRDRNWDETIFVAETSAGVVGFCALSNISPFIQAVFVHPDWTRQGIATELIAALEAEAVERQIKRLIVNSSLTAEPFYRARGYQVIKARHHIWVGKGWQFADWNAIPCVKMQKQLIPETWQDELWKWVLFIGMGIAIALLMFP